MSNLLKPTGEPDDLETCMSGSGGEFAKVPLDGNSVGSYPAEQVRKAKNVRSGSRIGDFARTGCHGES